MPRKLALVKASVWEAGSDFRNLTKDAQRLYLLLISQSQITNCGVVPWMPTRWARMAADETLTSIERTMGELEQERYVIVDREAGEVLVRTFVRHDKVLEKPQLLQAAQREFLTIESADIRQELRRQHPDVFNGESLRATVGQDIKLPPDEPMPAPVAEPVTAPVAEPVEEPVEPPLRARARAGARRPLPLTPSTSPLTPDTESQVQPGPSPEDPARDTPAQPGPDLTRPAPADLQTGDRHGLDSLVERATRHMG